MTATSLCFLIILVSFIAIGLLAMKAKRIHEKNIEIYEKEFSK